MELVRPLQIQLQTTIDGSSCEVTQRNGRVIKYYAENLAKNKFRVLIRTITTT